MSYGWESAPAGRTLTERRTATLQLNVYSRRYGRHDRYHVERTDYGWIVEHAGVGGPCDKAGEPYLFQNLKHDSINYPADLGGYMEWLWGHARNGNMPDAEIQGHLDALAGWIETAERASPKGLWQDQK